MADPIVLISPTITLDSVDMTTFIKEVTLDVEADDVDSTAFGPDGWKTRKPGLKGAEIKLVFNTEFNASTVDDQLWGWFTGGVPITFTARADDGAISATNPQYSGSVVVLKMSPLAGKVGDLAEQSLTWPITGAVARAVS